MPFDYPNSVDNDIQEEERRLIRKAAQALGRIGGSKKSDRKAISSRENGKLGGRPKTIKQESEA